MIVFLCAINFNPLNTTIVRSCPGKPENIIIHLNEIHRIDNQGVVIF